MSLRNQNLFTEAEGDTAFTDDILETLKKSRRF